MSVSEARLPEVVASEAQLDELLAQPRQEDVETLTRLPGDVAVLGAGGKMGPSLALRLRRAADGAGGSRRVYAVSRFSSPGLARSLAQAGLEVVAADLLDPRQVDALPAADNVFFLAGSKFGSGARPELTWAANTVAPAHVARRYAGARVVAFSTGNVYPFVDADGSGCRETDRPAPLGEYAQSCLGRERLFEHYSRQTGMPCVLFRLNYAVDLRYGVLVDVARRVLAGEPIDLTVPRANALWQGDAHSYALRSLSLCATPPRVLNVTGAAFRVRDAAERFGSRFGRAPRFAGEEGRLALLSDPSLCQELLGPPEVRLERLFHWVEEWVASGGRSLDKPTAFERTDGRY